MKRLFELLRNAIVNFLLVIVSIFVRRDKQIWLFGAWMGQRFADNTRFLFQYINDNKEKLHIKKVIWITDNKDLLKEMQDFGYEVYLKKSKDSFYWHLKSGVHVVCNMYAKTGLREGDIWGELSTGAIKVQLWHGVGIKAVGYLRTVINGKKGTNKIRNVLRKRYLLGNPIFSPGGWGNRYQIATSDENARVAIQDIGVKPSKIIMANYPRLSGYVKLLPSESEEIEKFKNAIHNRKVILYCPTFREKTQANSKYHNPTDSLEFQQFLENNNFLWIEKRHFASSFKFDNRKSDAVYYLDGNLDTNLLYEYIDVLITDYSSAASDCIYKGIKVLSYVEDMDDYVNEERGFVNSYEKYYPGLIAKSLKELQIYLMDTLEDNYFDDVRTKKYNDCKKFLYEERPSDINWIFEQIRTTIRS